MNATSLYVTTSRLVFQSEQNGAEQNWTDLYRLVPYLRQSLSCLVCGKLLSEPQKPSDGKCQHHVCKRCISGRKIIKPSCVHCRDNFELDCYEENIQMRILLQCYKYLCQYIMSSALYKTNVINSGAALNGTDSPRANLFQFIEEGANFSDNFKANSGLSKNAYSILPCVFSPISSSPIPTPSESPQQTIPISVQSPPLTISCSPQLIQTVQPQIHSPTIIIQQQPVTQPASSFQPSQIIQINQHQSSNQYSKKIIHNQIQKTQQTMQQQQTNLQQQQAPPPLTLVNNSICINPTTGATTNFKISKNNALLTQSSIKAINNNLSSNNLGNSKTINLNQNQIQTNIISWPPKNNITISSTPVSISAASLVNEQQKTSSLQTTSTISQSTPVTIRNPPPIKTVSNGSAMYSVLYSGIGNKITIKRKTDNEDDTKKNNIQYPPPRPSINKTVSKRRGCRCGNATPTPGKLTCCGQRCPCYVESKSCIDCKCRGCRNPHRPDGCKIRPVIPELACYEIQIADDSTNLSPNTSLTSIATSSSPATTTNFVQQSQIQQVNQQKMSPVVTATKLNTASIKMEIPLDDYSTSTTSNLLGNIVVASPQQLQTNSPSTTSTTFSYTTQPTFVVKKPQTITFAPTTNQLKRQQQSQLQTQTIQPQTIKIENASTESLLIKSADGKYQVVNVYTSTPHLQQSTTTNFDRFTTTIPLQTNNLLTTKNHHIPDISTSLPQIIMQPQTPNQQSTTTTILSATSSSSTSHQTLNSLSSPTFLHNHHNTQQQHILTATPQQITSPGTTITLSPITLVTSSGSGDHSFPSEIFSEEEIISTTQSSNSSSSPLSHPPPLHFTNHHPHLVEVVHTEDL